MPIICQKTVKSIVLRHKAPINRENRNKNVQEVSFISAKFKTLAVIYSLAALLVLAGVTAMGQSRLALYRRAADYSAAQAFDETVAAVEELSVALKKLQYTTDDILGRSICSKAYAEAMSAEASMSVLPFSTHELEKLSAFLNTAADYTASLLVRDETELGEEHREHLRQLSDSASDFSARLTALQGEVNDGGLLMDSLEQNFAYDGGERLSARLLSYEQEFESPEEFVYDGKYSPAEEKQPGTISPEEAKDIAAKAAGVEARELKDEYSYEGPEGRHCYSAGDLKLCVSSRGLESMNQSRLLSSGGMDAEEARTAAEDFLAELGYESLAMSSENVTETLASYRYAPDDEGALRRDDYISISVALDDGSIYAFDATRYSAEAPELLWNIDEKAALKALPDGAEVSNAQKLIIKSPGGRYLPCWGVNCSLPDSESACVYVNAETGKQCRIDICG